MSETKDTALVRQGPRSFSLLPQSLGEAMEIARLIANSDFAPRDYKNKPESVLIAIQMGADIGLKPMQAIQNIAVVNGRPSIYGDAALALVMPVLERFSEEFTGTFPNDDFTAVCVSKRKGWPDETKTTFSIGDARKAGLWGKSGTWTTYPQRMLMWRARSFNLRTVGADLMLGLVLAEEAQDYPSIEGTVVSSEVVEPVVSLLDKLPDGLRDNVEKAFSTLNLAPGMRLAKVNEFMGGDGVDPEAGAQAILDWCRDEYAKRKTGQGRAKKGNAKAKADDAKTAGEDPVPPSANVDPAGGTGVRVPVVEGRSGSDQAGPKRTSPAPESDVAPEPPLPQESELF